MIPMLAVNDTPILVRSNDNSRAAAETDSDVIVMWAEWVICEISDYNSNQNHSDLVLTATDNALRELNNRKGDFQVQKMKFSVKAWVDNPVAAESPQVSLQNICKIHPAMEIDVYGAETITKTKLMQCTMSQNNAWHVATTWWDADPQKAKEQLQHKIYRVKPVICNLWITDSNTMNNNYGTTWGVRRTVPEEDSLYILPKYILWQWNKFTRWQVWLLTIL